LGLSKDRLNNYCLSGEKNLWQYITQLVSSPASENGSISTGAMFRHSGSRILESELVSHIGSSGSPT